MSFLLAAKHVVSACARRTGLSISRRQPPPPYARHLKEFLDLKSINCVLDVGTFGGGFASVYPVNTFHAGQITPEFDVLFSRYDGSLTGQ